MTHALTPEVPPEPRLPISTLLMRIKAEFNELPGLQLTAWQAQRLWGLDEVQCEAILAALIDAAFLRRTGSGTYVRASAVTDGDSVPLPSKVEDPRVRSHRSLG